MEEKKNTETVLEKAKERPMEEWNVKKYAIIALIAFITFCCCILFFFMIYRYNGFADFWKELVQIVQPITIGLVLAYLLNPVMKLQEKYLLKFLLPRMKIRRKAKKTARSMAIFGTLIFLVVVVALLIVMILPATIESIQEMIATLPNEINNIVGWVEDFTQGDTEVAEFARQTMESFSNFMRTFWEEGILSQAQAYITSITSGVIYSVKLVMNIIVGVIVSVYVMASKETFAGQAKKITYAIFKPLHANVIIDTVRKSHEIFGGFIIGKIVDSAIIGVLAYIILAIMKMPDTMLVAVIIGITNVIPFFGPFIGAIPSFLLIVIQSPIQGLYFLIFIFILQQIDGNIIGPAILGNSTGLSSFWVVFSILLFGGLWGFPGMLLGVPTMAVIYYIAQEIITYFLRKKGLAPETDKYIHLEKVEPKTKELVYEDKARVSLKEKRKKQKKERQKEET